MASSWPICRSFVKRTVSGISSAAALCSLALLTEPAWSQTRGGPRSQVDVDPAPDAYFMGDVAGNRIMPEFQPLAIRIGGIVVAPRFELANDVDGNWLNRGDAPDPVSGLQRALPALLARFPEALPSVVRDEAVQGHVNPGLGVRGDLRIAFNPSVTVTGEWDDIRLGISADGRILRHARLHREDCEEYHAGIAGSLPLGGAGQLLASVSADRRAEVPGSNGTATLDYFAFGPSISRSVGGNFGVHWSLGGFSAHVDAELVRERYNDLILRTADLLDPQGLAVAGVPASLGVSQAFRDNDRLQLRFRSGWAVSPDFTVWVKPGFERTSHRVVAGGVASPDSDTYGLVVGVAKSFERLIVLDVGMGWQLRRYADAGLKDSRRIVVQGAVDWYPTPLLSLRLSIDQNFQGSAIPNVADLATRSLEFRADYEVLRNLTARLRLNAQWQRYPAAARPGAATTADVSLQAASVEVNYLASRGLSFRTYAGVHRRRSNEQSVLGDFFTWQSGLGLTLRI